LRYVYSAQYPNGGFPQMYPIVGGYHDGVTFNDDAMTGILELLRDVCAGNELGGTALNASLRTEARERFDAGIRCVLATQLKDAAGHRTVWCQQYDPLTLRAAAARNFEPIADVSRESAGITLLLMSNPNPSPAIVAAIEGAVAWFRRTALHDMRIAKAPADLRGNAIPSPGAPLLWARFYEPGSSTPIFGDRDRTIHYALSEVSAERVAGYSWYTTVPNKVLETYPEWQKRIRAK
jgi:PelA/Pel-15E family pectate lyase